MQIYSGRDKWSFLAYNARKINFSSQNVSNLLDAKYNIIYTYYYKSKE